MSDIFDGILLVDKPKGPTSHDIVDAVRRRFHCKRVGHCGTLDPMATGLLILVLGRATKLADKFSGEDKTYTGTMLLGIETDTQDAEGESVATKEVPPLTPDQIEAAFAKFRGDVMQTPPMYSAKKIAGQVLYRAARKGKDIPREPKLVHIYDLRVTALDLPRVSFLMTCSKGTYVRTIATDIGRDLGCGAHLVEIRRHASGRFRIENAHPLADILTRTADQLREWLISPLSL